MFKYIKDFVGKLTLPKDTYKCRSGSFWVSSNYYGEEYPFQYQQIEQGFWGNWKLASSWMGICSELAKV